MKTIYICETIGKEIRTRIFFRRDIDRLLSDSNAVCLDFSGVIFITRSVADEIYNVELDYPNTTIANLEGEARKMYEVVKHGRVTPRVFEKANFENIRLRNFEEAIRYFDQAF